MQALAADDPLAVMEHALQGLRKTIAALPTAAEGASATAADVGRRWTSGASCRSSFVDALGLLQSSMRRPGHAQECVGDDPGVAQLSAAEAGLANAMELLDSSFKERHSSHPLMTTPPPTRPKWRSPAHLSTSGQFATEAAQPTPLAPAQMPLRRSLSARMLSSPPETRSSPGSVADSAVDAALSKEGSLHILAETTPCKLSTGPRRPPLAPTSLASRLSAFEPPVPPALRSKMPPSSTVAGNSNVQLAEARVELKSLSNAAQRAAQMCPDAAMLADCLCAAVARELQSLSVDPQRPVFQCERQELERRISDLRKATAEGLQVLELALQPDAGQAGNDSVDCFAIPDDQVLALEIERSPSMFQYSQATPGPSTPIIGFEQACREQMWRSPADVMDTSGSTIASVRSSVRSPVEISEIFGSVAANMQRTVDEIRKARSIRGHVRHYPTIASPISSPIGSSSVVSPSMALAAAAGA